MAKEILVTCSTRPQNTLIQNSKDLKYSYIILLYCWGKFHHMRSTVKSVLLYTYLLDTLSLIATVATWESFGREILANHTGKSYW